MKYYGSNEVKDIVNNQNDTSTLILDSGKQITLPNKMIAVAVTDTATDLTTLREKRCFPVVADVLKVLHDWNVNISEIDFISQRVIMSINESIKKSEEILWGKPMVEQNMEDVNKILLSNPEEVAPQPIPSQFMETAGSDTAQA